MLLPVTGKVGEFDAELAEEVFRAIAFNGGITLHLTALAGKNTHHLIEAAFKAFARGCASPRKWSRLDPDSSTKGVL